MRVLDEDTAVLAAENPWSASALEETQPGKLSAEIRLPPPFLELEELFELVPIQDAYGTVILARREAA